MNAIEKTITCSDGIKLALKIWKSSQPAGSTNTPIRRILCCHGWLDNLETYHILAPKLASQLSNTEIIAMDFPGHGLSSHKSPDGPPILLSEGVFYVAEAIQQILISSSPASEDKKITLIGHSMGAAVSMLYAAAYPEQLKSLILLDGAAPASRAAKDVAKFIRKACDKRMQSNLLLYPQFDEKKEGSTHHARVYNSIDQAIEARMKTASYAPGHQYISREAATALVTRATIPAASDENKIQFRHDVRLQWPSMQYFTQEQVIGAMQDVRCRILLLLAEDGWPFDEKYGALVEETLNIEHKFKLKGSHHFHADPDTAMDVVNKICEFLKKEESNVEQPW